MSEYTVKGVKSFRGMEGLGFNAWLYRDGKKVCFVIDEANGGEYRYEWADGREVAKLHEHIKGMFYPEPGPNGKQMEMGPDGFLAELVDKFEEAKAWKRRCRTATYFRLKDETYKDGEWLVVKAPFDHKVRDYIIGKYGSRMGEILNEKFAA